MKKFIIKTLKKIIILNMKTHYVFSVTCGMISGIYLLKGLGFLEQYIHMWLMEKYYIQYQIQELYADLYAEEIHKKFEKSILKIDEKENIYTGDMMRLLNFFVNNHPDKFTIDPQGKLILNYDLESQKEALRYLFEKGQNGVKKEYLDSDKKVEYYFKLFEEKIVDRHFKNHIKFVTDNNGDNIQSNFEYHLRNHSLKTPEVQKYLQMEGNKHFYKIMGVIVIGAVASAVIGGCAVEWFSTENIDFDHLNKINKSI